jgi:hypothetical protein
MCFHVHASGKSGSVHSGLTANTGSASKRFRGCTIISQRFRVHPVSIANTLLGCGDPLSTDSVPRPSRTVSPRQQPGDPAPPCVSITSATTELCRPIVVRSGLPSGAAAFWLTQRCLASRRPSLRNSRPLTQDPERFQTLSPRCWVHRAGTDDPVLRDCRRGHPGPPEEEIGGSGDRTRPGGAARFHCGKDRNRRGPISSCLAARLNMCPGISS